MITYSAMDTPPMVSVEIVGVRKRLWILENALGMALNTAIDSVVRAVGRMVVCVDAAAELSTIRMSSLVRKRAEARRAEDGGAEHRQHVARCGSGFCRPIPVVPMPA